MTNPLTEMPFHKWRKTHPEGTMDQYFTEVQGLTPYDTGKRLQPQVWKLGLSPALPAEEEAKRYGKVDFEDEESATILTAYVERNEDKSYTLHVDAACDLDEIKVQAGENEGSPFIINPSLALQAKVQEVIGRLDSELERDGAEVFYQEGRALVLVPGEKGYRKQQAILVEEPGTEGSGLGWRSDRDYSGITSAIVKSWSSGLQRTRD